MYKQASETSEQPTNGADQGQDEGAEADLSADSSSSDDTQKKDDDDVIDAEFTEK